MPRFKGIKNGRHSSTCFAGHDISTVGRDSSFHCKECERIRNLKRKPQMDINKNNHYWGKILKIKNEEGLPFQVSDYNRLFQIQGGRCANSACNRHQSELSRGLAVDHDHETGKVRGLLCCNCNSGLGQLGDTIERVEGILEYLKSKI
jgi:Recombination endonuclease VII